jgi:acid phosphatase (class A)
MVYLLIGMVPEKRAELLRRGGTFAQARATCGVHYPSDLIAGKQAGAWLSQRILEDPGYLKAAEVAKRELREALKLPAVPAPG